MDIYCYSHVDFDKLMFELGWLDVTKLPADVAIVSICGTKECQEFYLEESEYHWFDTTSSAAVCNLDFDDVTCSEFSWKGHIFRGISSQQAKELVEFIERNQGKDFYIHCRAGHSRSQGVVRYILDTYPGYEIKNLVDLTPNWFVVETLKKEKGKL